MLSPIVLLVFAPVVVGGMAFAALLMGAAAAGGLEAVERRSSDPDKTPTPLRVAAQEVAPARAA